MIKALLSTLMLYGSLACSIQAQTMHVADTSTYLSSIKKELQRVWPDNRTIHLVFHGHSVPAGYGDRHEVHTLTSYPYQLLGLLKARYPYAVINVIVTAIGGENSIQGEKRLVKEVFPHQADVLFIDYALNDRFQDKEQVKKAYESMIQQALQRGIKVVLVTPSPDQRLDISDPANPLEAFADQIQALATKYQIGLADPYARFKTIAKQGDVKHLMESVNHPNEKGHMIIAEELMRFF